MKYIRKKLVTKTYMKEVTDYEIVIVNHEEEHYSLCIKKINKVNPPFVLQKFDKDITLIDNGYYILEYTPINEYYNGRVYLDKYKNIIEYYFDISNGNGIEDKVPYYDDLYLDVLYYPNENHLVEYADRDELEKALEEGQITKEEFDKAIVTGEQLVEEIKNRKNFFMNLDFTSLIEKYFGKI